MDARDFQHCSPALLRQRKVVAHAENHQGADGLGQEGCTRREDAAHANTIEPGADAGKVQK